jgi:hypothetical protein
MAPISGAELFSSTYSHFPSALLGSPRMSIFGTKSRRAWYAASGSFVTSYGAFWALFDSLGFEAGAEMFFVLTIFSVLVGCTTFLGVQLKRAVRQIQTIDQERLQLERENAKFGRCPFTSPGESHCPVGLVDIHPRAKDTLRTSLERPTKSFHWLGLSAFNVIHNNLEPIRSKYRVKYVFTILNPKNALAQRLTDQYYNNADDKLHAKDLTATTKSILETVESKAENVVVQFYDSMPTFRLALIDDEIAQVSFYQRGGDVLERPQLEFTIDKDDPLSIGSWLFEFYEIMTKWNPRLNDPAELGT